MKCYNLKSALEAPTRVKELYLTGRQFRGIPTQVFELANLEKLELSTTLIQEIPDTIAQLQKLKTLNIHNSEVRHLPNAIASLPLLSKVRITDAPMAEFPAVLAQCKLELLRLDGLNIREIGSELCQIKSLEVLSIDNCLIKKLPKDIGNLKQLKSLSISKNQLTRLPTSIGKCSQITSFGCQENQLKVLPDWIGNYTQLTHLYLFGNKLKALPESIGQCIDLRLLFIQDNKLATLPYSFGQLRRLRQFTCSNNPITHLPDSVGNLDGLRAWHITKTKLTQLPATMAQLNKLENLTITKNHLAAIPDWIGSMSNLEVFRYESSTLLTRLPESMSQLKRIKRLSFGRRRIYEFVPTPLLGLTTLVEIGGFSHDFNILPFIKLTKQVALLPHQIKSAFELLHADAPHEITSELSLQDLLQLYLLKSDPIQKAVQQELAKRKGKTLPNEPLSEMKSLYVLGKTAFHLPTLKAKLTQHQINWHAQPKDTTTHVLLGNKLKDIPTFTSTPTFINQYELNQYLNSLATHYLQNPVSASKRQRINQMLLSNSDTNFALALQLLEGGGLHEENYTALFIATRKADKASLKRKMLDFLSLHLVNISELANMQKVKKGNWEALNLSSYWDKALLKQELG